MTRREGTRYSVRREFKDTVTVFSRRNRTPILVEVYGPRAVSFATACKQQRQAAARSAGAGIQKKTRRPYLCAS